MDESVTGPLPSKPVKRLPWNKQKVESVVSETDSTSFWGETAKLKKEVRCVNFTESVPEAPCLTIAESPCFKAAMNWHQHCPYLASAVSSLACVVHSTCLQHADALRKALDAEACAMSMCYLVEKFNVCTGTN